jgi:DNA-binding CsgD family transcriptional regulator
VGVELLGGRSGTGGVADPAERVGAEDGMAAPRGERGFGRGPRSGWVPRMGWPPRGVSAGSGEARGAGGVREGPAVLWEARAADQKRRGMADVVVCDSLRPEYTRRLEEALEAGQLRGAREPGARMTVSAATELGAMVTSAAQHDSPDAAAGEVLSPRERELVTLVAQGHTNAQIAAQLYISVRTVASHLDRIGDKTGCRRRADLTRLALEEGLV